MVENKVLVVAGSSGSERPLLPDGDGVDLLGVAIDLSNSISTVPSNAVAVALLSIADRDDALGITIPGKIIDAAVDNTVFTLGDSIADTVPNPD